MKFYYKGKRYNDRRMVHVFWSEAYGTATFAKIRAAAIRGVVIGREYEIKVVQHEKGSTFHWPEWWSDAMVSKVPHKDAAEWQARSRVDMEKYKASNKSTNKELDKHIEALRDACGRMSDIERGFFLAHLITRFMRWR